MSEAHLDLLAQAYQVVGALAEYAGVFDDPAVQKVLNILDAVQPPVNREVAAQSMRPFVLPERPDYKAKFYDMVEAGARALAQAQRIPFGTDPGTDYTFRSDARRCIDAAFTILHGESAQTEDGGEDEHVIRLNPEEWARFTEVLANPPAPTDKLVEVFQRYRAVVQPAQGEVCQENVAVAGWEPCTRPKPCSIHAPGGVKCGKCGSASIVLVSAAEGYSCRDCGASDSDES